MSQKEIVNVFDSLTERLTSKDIACRLGSHPRNSAIQRSILRCVQQCRLIVVDTYNAPGRGAPSYIYQIHPDCDLWRD